MRKPCQLGKYPISSAPLDYRNTRGWGPCARCTSFWQPEWIWELHKSSARTKIVYMELSLRVIFQLNRSLRGYMVATTVGFWVTTMDALALWPHHRIPQRYPQRHMSTYSVSCRVNGPTTCSTKGSGATIRVLYPLYRGPSVTAQKIWIQPSSLQWKMVGEPCTP
jgi:hypothetical protein